MFLFNAKQIASIKIVNSLWVSNVLYAPSKCDNVGFFL